MYLWKVDDLVEDLKAGRVSQQEQFEYCRTFLIIGVVVVLILVSPTESIFSVKASPEYRKLAEVLYAICGIYILALAIIAFPGIWVCYQINRKGDDTDFLLRMVCLSIPVFIRTAVFFYVPLIALISILLFGAVAGFSFAVAVSSNATFDEMGEWRPFLIITLPIFLVMHFVPCAYQAVKIHKVSRDV